MIQVLIINPMSNIKLILYFCETIFKDYYIGTSLVKTFK